MSSEACADEAVLREVPKLARSDRQGRNLIGRYWGEMVVIALAIILWLPRLSGPIDLRWDAGVYYLLGTSLATGHGYRILSEPGAPEALQYPPLLPAVVALYERALGSTDPAIVGSWLRKSYAALYLAFALVVLALARRYLRTGFAVIAVALSLLQVNTLFCSDLLFTELPFALVSVVFVLVAVDGPLESRPWLQEMTSFALAAVGFLLRTAGIALLGAWVLEALARRHWRLALTRGLLALLPILAWQAHVARVRGSYEYAHPAYEYQRAQYQFYNVSYAENVSFRSAGSKGSHARALAARLAVNVRRMAKALGEAISTSEGYWRQLLKRGEQSLVGKEVIPARIVIVPIIGLSVLVVGGVGVLAYRRAWLIVFIIVASGALICTTPWTDQFQRYLMPLTPFLAIAALVPLSQCNALLRAKTLHSAIGTVARILLTGFLALALLSATHTAAELFSVRQREGASFVPGREALGWRFFYHDRLWLGWEQATAWIKQYAPADAIVATPASHLCYLRTGRHAVAPPVESDPARVRHLLESVPVSYVIVDRGYNLPAVETDPQNWRLVESFDGTKLYERTTGASE